MNIDRLYETYLDDIKKLYEYTSSTNYDLGGGRTVAPRMDHPNSDQYFKIRTAVASFPYIQIDDVDDVDIINLEEYFAEEESSKNYPYPFVGYEDSESFELSHEIDPSIGGVGIGTLQTPSKAGGGDTNQNMPVGMNSHGWASAPRNTEKAKNEKDYMKDFLSKFYE